jgi:sugar phosphate isomerase/epimerase
MHRREFLFSAAAAGLAASALHLTPARAGALVKKIGVQFFSLPKNLEKDFDGTLGMLKRLGYSEVEFYGPYEFSAPEAVASWAKVTPQLGFSGSGFYGLTAQKARALLDKHVLTAPSMHTDLETLQTRMGPLSDAAHVIGATYVVLPAIPQEKRKTLDDYKRMVDAFNSIGDQAVRHGVKFGYHNHGYGLKEMQGQVPLQLLLKGTDPKKVFFEMDIYWTTAGGADPVKLLKENASRYKMLHMKDMKEHKVFKGDGGDPSQWMELFPYMTTVGDGVIDIKAIVAQAQASGVEHLFVEQDMVANPEVALKRSADYLLKL